MSQPRNVAIIGSGPAGLTAAIYTARANLEPLLLEGEPSSTSDQPGGQLMLTTEVENFPGFPEGVMGPDLMMRFREQAIRFGTDVRQEKVSRVDLSARPFQLWVGDPDAPEPTYTAHSVIVSTGAQSLMLGLPRERELIGHGVSTCATCDGFFFKDQHIAVVGGGDSAMEEANFLTRFGSKVSLIHRSENFRASQIMLERARANEKIEFVTHTIVEEVMENAGKVAGLKIKNVQTGESSVLDATAMFVAIGHDPRSGFLEGQVATDEAGYVEVRQPSTVTSLPGVFACGDLVDNYYRQAITAAGSGCRAAIDAEHYLAGLE